ncbi:MAG: Bifunctional ligase/repressor BirA [Ignavibacteria bacterium]|nr:Bifunctional ligase/repressor BirA [Ignavibacteria bacterium]
MNIESLNNNLVKENLLSRIVFLDEVDSTNKFASVNYAELPHDTLIITEFQKMGKGRFERKWESSKGTNLMFTLLKELKIDIDKIHNVIFYTSYMLFNTLKEILDDTLGKNLLLKWPNDVLLNRKKTAGILLEVKNLKQPVKLFIIGIGLNVNETDFQSDNIVSATSLKKETGKEFSREDILEKFIINFYKNYNLLKESDKLIDEWKKNSFGIDEKISFSQYEDDKEKSGYIKDIDHDGAIMIRFDDGSVKKFYSGEIKIKY